jgi:hypothetical protein
MTAPTGKIGRDVFSYLHDFHWDDYTWTCSVPSFAELETFEEIVHVEHPRLLKLGIGNVEIEQ